MTKEYLLCSDCFYDEGLRFDAGKIGNYIKNACPHCGSKRGAKLAYNDIIELCKMFYVVGTIEKSEYAEAPILGLCANNKNKEIINLDERRKHDLRILEKYGKLSVNYSAPNLWLLGENEVLKRLQCIKKRDGAIKDILNRYPIKELGINEKIYRVRLNPTKPNCKDEYDTPPNKSKDFGRFDTVDFPIFYGSQDLNVCLYECKTSMEDKVYVATFQPKHILKVLDLTEIIDDSKTEFESMDIAIYFLFLASQYSYDISRKIAEVAKEKGIDGIIYPSYFSNIRTGAISRDTLYGISIRRIKEFKKYNKSIIIPNIAIFGYPVKENKLELSCINKIFLRNISYDIVLGVVLEED